MRILQVHNRYCQAGGEDSVVKAEGKLLNHMGETVLLEQVDNSSISGFVGKAMVGASVVYSKKSRSRLEAKIKDFRPDVVHVHNFFPLLSPSIFDACGELKVPVVCTLHNYRLMCAGAFLMRNGSVCEICINKSPYHALLYGCYRNSRIGTFFVARMIESIKTKNNLANSVTRFIALTDFSKEKFTQAGFSSHQIMVKPNFSKDNMVFPRCFDGGALFVGRLSVEKGVGTLIKSWRNLLVHLNVIGDGPLLDEVNSCGLDHVSVHGWLPPDDVSKFMSKASFLIMPSQWYEGFPMVLVEAFSHGVPVITSKLGGMAEIVEDGVTGLHFKAGDAGDLAEKVRWVQSHPEACKRMGSNARKVYLEKYTSEVNYKMLMNIYQEAIDSYA